MTVFGFMVGSGIFWFICFLYVVHAIARGEGPEVRGIRQRRPGLHLAQTRVKRGIGPGV